LAFGPAAGAASPRPVAAAARVRAPADDPPATVRNAPSPAADPAPRALTGEAADPPAEAAVEVAPARVNAARARVTAARARVTAAPHAVIRTSDSTESALTAWKRGFGVR